MSEPPPDDLPGNEPALEPGHDFPDWPMTAADVGPLIPKVVD